MRHDGGLISDGVADEVDFAGDNGFGNGVLTEAVVRRAVAKDVVEVVFDEAHEWKEENGEIKTNVAGVAPARPRHARFAERTVAWITYSATVQLHPPTKTTTTQATRNKIQNQSVIENKSMP